MGMMWSAMAAGSWANGWADAWTLLSSEGAQAVLVIALAGLVSRRSRHPIAVAAGD